MIPFFGYLSFGNPFENGGGTSLTLSMVSTVVSNVTGLMTGGLYLFLRSSTISSISPKNKLDEYERQQMKYQIGMPKPGDTDFNNHIMKPVVAPQWLRDTEIQEKRALKDRKSHYESQLSAWPLIADEPNPLRLNAAFKQMPALPSPTSTQSSLSMMPPRKQSTTAYTLFPNQNQERTSKVLLPATTYSPNAGETLVNGFYDTLMPPPSIRAPEFRHRRESSMASSATVQIGLRLSNVDDVRPTTAGTIGAPERTHELGCPNNPKPELINRPAPLFTRTSSTASPSSRVAIGSAQLKTAMKTLPSVPQDSQVETETAPLLNPTVYSPKSPTKAKVPSPKGVGFNVPARSVTTPVELIEVRSPVRRPHGDVDVGDADKANWI